MSERGFIQSFAKERDYEENTVVAGYDWFDGCIDGDGSLPVGLRMRRLRGEGGKESGQL
jgi:hypothetical protein